MPNLKALDMLALITVSTTDVHLILSVFYQSEINNFLKYILLSVNSAEFKSC